MKWTFEEDYLVCKFYLAHIESWGEHIGEIMEQLNAAGFGARPKGSVRMRIQNYEYLLTGDGLSNVATQSRNVYTVMVHQAGCPSDTMRLRAYISQNYLGAPVDTMAIRPFSDGGLSSFVMIEPLGRPFSEVLLGLIDKHGLTDSQVYNAGCVSRQTFSDIRNNKTNISKKTVIQLCIGAQLTYEEGLQLMEAAGYTLSNNQMIDVIIAWHLKERVYDTNKIDTALCDYQQKSIFSIA
jgi:hypothetical protein